MRRIRARGGRSGSSARNTEVNPMEHMSNLSDVMLVLAVGIMLALIINWNVDITTVTTTEESEDNPRVEITQDDLTEQEEQSADESQLQKVGGLYYDEETGTYYAVTGE